MRGGSRRGTGGRGPALPGPHGGLRTAACSGKPPPDRGGGTEDREAGRTAVALRSGRCLPSGPCQAVRDRRRRGGLGEPGQSGTGRGQGWMLGKRSRTRLSCAVPWPGLLVKFLERVTEYQETWNNAGRRSKREERRAQVVKVRLKCSRATGSCSSRSHSSSAPCAPGHGSCGNQHLRSLVRVTHFPPALRHGRTALRCVSGRWGAVGVPSLCGRHRAHTRFACWACQRDYTGSSPGSARSWEPAVDRGWLRH